MVILVQSRSLRKKRQGVYVSGIVEACGEEDARLNILTLYLASGLTGGLRAIDTLPCEQTESISTAWQVGWELL